MLRMRRTIVLLAVTLVPGGASFAQEHSHIPQANQSSGSPAPTTTVKEEIAVFCPTMKTGQLCSSGTANILQLQGEQAVRIGKPR